MRWIRRDLQMMLGFDIVGIIIRIRDATVLDAHAARAVKQVELLAFNTIVCVQATCLRCCHEAADYYSCRHP